MTDNNQHETKEFILLELGKDAAYLSKEIKAMIVFEEIQSIGLDNLPINLLIKIRQRFYNKNTSTIPGNK